MFLFSRSYEIKPRQRKIGWEFVARMLDNRLLEQDFGVSYNSLCKGVRSDGRESTCRTPLPAYFHRSFSAVVYLIEGGKRRRYLSLCMKKIDRFLYTSPYGNCILLQNFWFKLVFLEKSIDLAMMLNFDWYFAIYLWKIYLCKNLLSFLSLFYKYFIT